MVYSHFIERGALYNISKHLVTNFHRWQIFIVYFIFAILHEFHFQIRYICALYILAIELSRYSYVFDNFSSRLYFDSRFVSLSTTPSLPHYLAVYCQTFRDGVEFTLPRQSALAYAIEEIGLSLPSGVSALQRITLILCWTCAIDASIAKILPPLEMP